MRLSMNEKIISIIDKLIAVCKDGAEGFQLAANEIHASLVQSLFRGYSLQRSRFSGDLQTAASAFGKTVPPEERSGTDPLAAKPKGAVSPRDEQTVLSVCEREEEAAVAAYTKALEEPD